MSDAKPESEKADPMASMMKFYERWTEAWAKSLSDTVANPQFAETMAEQTEGGLEFWAQVRRQVGGAMEQYLQQMSLPTQSEVVSLAERLTNIEMRLDDMDEKLDQLLDQLRGRQD
jgi:polyhydroxyalkanoate synthesis regulator phasin